MKSMSKVFVLILLCVTLLIACSPFVSAQTGDSWTTKTTLPTARSMSGIATVDNKIYVIGGYKSGHALATVEMYDPSTDSWVTKTSMPTARFGLGVASLNGKIYAMGGGIPDNSYAGFAYFSTLEIYDTATDSWKSGTPMPTNRSCLGAASINGRIYAMGGFTAGSLSVAIDTNEMYNPSTDSWTTAAPLPNSRAQFGITASETNIFVLGGEASYGGPQATFASYSPTTNSWNQLPSMPQSRTELSAIFLNGKVYAIGGEDFNGGSTKLNQQYDLATDKWTILTPMPTGRVGLAVASANGKIYAITGATGSYWSIPNFLNTNEEYTPPIVIPTPTPSSTATSTANSSPSTSQFTTPTPTVSNTAQIPELDVISFYIILMAIVFVCALIKIIKWKPEVSIQG